ncbi:glycoside hydrolase family 108 protein [Devosia geojensis]|uniref:glycoside hydrolase family 108 protein n=1 Tax=Devosia geojensis TaxID=443610 RepID=UPI0009FCB72E|nr:glycosyl hydrolase 108 family protein [Devosia geojensis]
MANERFEACLAEVLRHEGGYADHPSDPGGATNMGITRKTLARWRGISPWTALPKGEVKALTRAEAARIYRAEYWNRCRADEMPPGLDLALFDFAVNSGPDRAAKTLQRLVGVAADGLVGPVTLGAVAAHAGRGDTAALVEALCDARLAFLQRLSTFPVFGRGWTARVAAVRKAALAAVGLTRPTPSLPNPWSKLMNLLSGYRTYIAAALMLATGIAQILGIDLPAFDGQSGGQLVLEAIAIIFLRKGMKGAAGA